MFTLTALKCDFQQLQFEYFKVKPSTKLICKPYTSKIFQQEAKKYGEQQCELLGSLFEVACDFVIEDYGARIYDGVHEHEAFNAICDFIC